MVGVKLEFAPFFDFDDASGEMQMMFDIPLPPFRFVSAPGFGDGSKLWGRPATSEKKKEVLTVGVLGVRGATRGVFRADEKPPGEKRPFAVGDCSQASTFEESKLPEYGCFP